MTSHLWLLLLLLPMLWYAYTILRLRSRSRTTIQSDPNQKLPFISVVIPFRNESRWISDLLDSLKVQDYPAEQWELILVDDHSLDSGPVLVKRAMESIAAKTHLFRLKVGKGKKEALAQGVANAKSDWVLATDADCHFGSGWIRSFANIILNQEANMICGPVLFRTDSRGRLAGFQKFEQAILMFVSRASLRAGRAFLANGANMAFKKSFFEKADLRVDDTPSGDDIFLLHHVKLNDPLKILFNDDSQAMVRTPTKNSLLRFLDQRIRWASKSRYYQDGDSLKYGLAITLANSTLLIGLFLYLCGSLMGIAFLLLLLIKFAVDGIIYFRARHFSELKYPWLSFIVIFAVYPFYTIGIALLSLLYKPRWKGRKI